MKIDKRIWIFILMWIYKRLSMVSNICQRQIVLLTMERSSRLNTFLKHKSYNLTNNEVKYICIIIVYVCDLDYKLIRVVMAL